MLRLLVTLFIGGLIASPSAFGKDETCTDGVDCYCDRVANPAAREFDPDVIQCEDFENPGLNDGGATWTRTYPGIVQGCWENGTPCSGPNYGPGCRALEGSDPRACFNILQEGACDGQGGDPGNDCVFQGTNALGHAMQQGRNFGIFGTAAVAPTRRFGVTWATRYTTNYVHNTVAFKSNEFGGSGHCILGCSTHSNKFVSSGGGFSGDFPSDFLIFNPQCSTGSCFSNATVIAGGWWANDVQIGVSPLASDYQQARDWPLGQWACRQIHIDGWGTSNMTWRMWHNGKLIVHITGIDATGNQDGTGPINSFTWNDYYNGINNGGYTGSTRAYRIEDNWHMTRGPEPAPCASIGFALSAPILLP